MATTAVAVAAALPTRLLVSVGVCLNFGNPVPCDTITENRAPLRVAILLVGLTLAAALIASERRGRPFRYSLAGVALAAGCAVPLALSSTSYACLHQVKTGLMCHLTPGILAPLWGLTIGFVLVLGPRRKPPTLSARSMRGLRGNAQRT